MTAEELFDGFAEKRAQLEEELACRYGDGVREHFAESARRTQNWTAEDYQRAGQHWTDLERRILGLLRAGAEPEDPRVRELIDEHYTAVTRFWTPNQASYTGLGQLYRDHPEFRARYDAQHPRLAEYLCTAIASYARERLS